MIKIAICDDERAARERVMSYVGEYTETRGDANIVTSSFVSAEQLLNAVIEVGPFDIYLLDIVMPDMSGIDLGLAIRRYDREGKIIYITATPAYGANSYQANAFFYLLKPVQTPKLFEVLDAAIAGIRNRKERCALVKTPNETRKLSYDSILYVELVRRSLVWTLTDGQAVRSVTVRTNFADAVAPLLRDDRFFLSGASHVLNLYHVTSVGKDAIVFKGERRLYMSKSACSAVRSAWLDFWLKNGGNK